MKAHSCHFKLAAVLSALPNVCLLSISSLGVRSDIWRVIRPRRGMLSIRSFITAISQGGPGEICSHTYPNTFWISSKVQDPYSLGWQFPFPFPCSTCNFSFSSFRPYNSSKTHFNVFFCSKLQLKTKHPTHLNSINCSLLYLLPEYFAGWNTC